MLFLRKILTLLMIILCTIGNQRTQDRFKKKSEESILTKESHRDGEKGREKLREKNSIWSQPDPEQAWGRHSTFLSLSFPSVK